VRWGRESGVPSLSSLMFVSAEKTLPFEVRDA
jgi:hypothetical protein